MTMNSERQLELAILLTAVLIKLGVLCCSSGNKKKNLCTHTHACVGPRTLLFPFITLLYWYFKMHPVFLIIILSNQSEENKRFRLLKLIFFLSPWLDDTKVRHLSIKQEEPHYCCTELMLIADSFKSRKLEQFYKSRKCANETRVHLGDIYFFSWVGLERLANFKRKPIV